MSDFTDYSDENVEIDKLIESEDMPDLSEFFEDSLITTTEERTFL